MSVRFFEPKKEIRFSRFFGPSFAIAAIIPVVCMLGFAIFGINWGIDFSGGTEMQVKFQKAVSAQEIRTALDQIGYSKNQVQGYGASENNEMLIRIEATEAFSKKEIDRVQTLLKSNFGDASVEPLSNMSDRLAIRLPVPHVSDATDTSQVTQALSAQREKLIKVLDQESGFRLRRTKRVGETQAGVYEAVMQDEVENGLVPYNVHFVGASDKVSQALAAKFGDVEIRRVEFVDSQVSKQLRTDGTLAVLYALLAMLIYIAIRFDVLFAPGAVVGLVQDVFAALFVFAFARVEFDLPSVAAILTVVGYSINNTIVVYDRIRETVPTGSKKPLSDEQVESYVNKAVGDTLSRSINTTLTTLFASVSLWIFAGGVIQSFAIVLSIGVAMGAFSSTFVAPATYLYLRKRYQARIASGLTQHDFGPTREDKARGVV